jgi:hypothetical protein
MPDFDYKLRGDVEDVKRMVHQLGGQVDLVGFGMNQVSATTDETRKDLTELRADFERYLRQFERRSNVQRAETRLGSLQDQVQHEFGHHGVVRRSAVGMLQAFDTGLVSEETIRNVGEQLMIQTPRYWLAPALVALAAWSADNPVLCERAVQEAFRRSPDKASLFFALITRRQGRMEASVRWLRHYLNAQNPALLGRDFATVLESVSQGAFSPAGRAVVQEFLVKWTEQLGSDQSTIDTQVNLWRAEVAEHSGPPTNSRFPNLAQLSPQWAALDLSLRGALTHGPLSHKYEQLLHEEIPPSDRIEDAVDDILDRLVRDYDEDELPLRRDLAMVEAIIEHDGDMDAAQATATIAQTALGKTLDYLTVQTSSALRPVEIGVSRATQRVAVGACADWFRTAHDQYSRQYRSSLPTDVRAQFAESHSVSAKTFNLPPWTGSFNQPMAQLEGSLAHHWDSHVGPHIDTMRYNWKRALIVPAIVVLVILVILGMIDVAFGLVIASIVAGIWGLVIRSRFQQAEANVAQWSKTLNDAKQQSLHRLRAASAELTDWQLEFQKYDAEAVLVHKVIENFRETQGSAAFERRTVSV